MNTYKNRRRDLAPGLGGIDWRDIGACCVRASGGLAWLVFVVVLLSAALRGAA